MGAEAVMPILAAGLVPKLAAGGALALLVAGGALLAERQLEVWSRGRQITALQADVKKIAGERDALRARNDELAAANEALAGAAQAQALRQAQVLAAAEQRAQEARRLLAAQERAGAEDRAAAEWLGGLVREHVARLAAGTPPDPCPAGTALRQVRERWR